MRVVSLVIVVALLGVATSVPAAPTEEEVTILGVAPASMLPRERVRIILSRPIDSGGMTSERLASELSVQIGGRVAPIVEVKPSEIIVRAPDELPQKPFQLQVVGMGLNLVSPELSAIEVPSEGATGIGFAFNDPRAMTVVVSAALAALGFSVSLWGYRRRLAFSRRTADELTSEVERLRFRLERESSVLQRRVEASDDEPDQREAGTVPPVPDQLVDAIEIGECALFWGGGLSAQAGYPTWGEALGSIVERSSATGKDKDELEGLLERGKLGLLVELLATRSGREIVIRELGHQWGLRRKPTPAMLAIASIPFTNVVTSVWDPLVESVFAPRNPTIVTGVSTTSLDTILSRDSFSVVRLWGTLQNEDSILLTPVEFRRAVAGNTTYGKYLASLALSQSHLFVGSSLETIEDYFSTVPSAPSSRLHFALVPEQEGVEAAREVFRARYNVELLVFRPTPGWPEVGRFLHDLASRVARSSAVPRAQIEPMRLVGIKLENIGPFRELSLKFSPDWNVFLGNNGSGKSTLLRAIALVLCGDDSRALSEGGRLLSTTADAGFVELEVGRETYRTELSRDRGGVRVNVGTRVSPLKTGRWVALAFPPLRGVTAGNPSGLTPDPTGAPVVEDVLPILTGQTDSRLDSLKQWLVNLDIRSRPGDGISEEQASRNLALRERFFEVFNAFVPGVNLSFVSVDRNTAQVTVSANGAKVPIDQVSQGTSSLLGWVGALLQRMSEIHGGKPQPWEEPAVVLIDEIDAHLHPEWQQKIVATLKEQFESVQFLATTHSPLIVGELDARQVFRVRWEDGQVSAVHPARTVKGMGVAGLLTSDMFGLSSTLDDETRALLETQRQLASSAFLSNDDKERLEDVNAKLVDLGFRYQVRDEIFTEYLKARRQVEQEHKARSAPGADQVRISNARASELVREALARGYSSERSE